MTNPLSNLLPLCALLVLSPVVSGCVAACYTQASKEMRNVEAQRVVNRDWLVKRLKWVDWQCLHEVTEEECMQMKTVTYEEFTRAQHTTDNAEDDIRLSRTQCVADAHRAGYAAGAALSEMGRSMQESQRNQVHCTSQVVGNTVYTHCQ